MGKPPKKTKGNLTMTVPTWVPTNAKVHIDLVGGSPQGRAWVDGIGEVAVSSLLGADAEANNYWGSDTVGYSASYLTSDGYGRASNPVGVAILGAALDKLLGNVTARLQFRYHTAEGTSPAGLILLSDDGANPLHCELSHAGEKSLDVYTFNGMSLQIIDVANDADGAINAFAITIAGPRCEISGNGSAVAEGEITEEVRPASNPFASAMIAASPNTFIQAITVYDAFPSLRELSSAA